MNGVFVGLKERGGSKVRLKNHLYLRLEVLKEKERNTDFNLESFQGNNTLSTKK